MATTGGASAPPKPWERAPSAGSSPFRPPSGMANTAAVVESAGVAQPGDINEKQSNLPPPDRTIGARPMPPRPWERNNNGGYNNSTMGYNSQYQGLGTHSYGMSPYGTSYGGLYGSNYGSTYRGQYGVGGSYGGGMLGGGYGLGNSFGGGGMYGNYNGGSMYGGGYGMGVPGPFQQGGDPNNPFGGSPAEPPNFWQAMLRVMHGVVNFFGRISILVDQNTQAFYFFATALIQLCDRAGMLYGELARFVFRLLGYKTKPRFHPKALPQPGQERPANYYIEEPKETGGAWDNVWSEEGMEKAG